MLIYMLESAYVGTVSRVFVSKMSGTRFSLYQSIALEHDSHCVHALGISRLTRDDDSYIAGLHVHEIATVTQDVHIVRFTFHV